MGLIRRIIIRKLRGWKGSLRAKTVPLIVIMSGRLRFISSQ